MAKIYLVDLENVSWKSLSNIENLNLCGRDKIYIFSGNNNNCPVDIMRSILNLKAKVEIVEIFTNGKNALDFQLATFLGKISKGSNNEFFIVSRDKGYHCLIPFLKEIDLKIIESFFNTKDNIIDLNEFKKNTNKAAKGDLSIPLRTVSLVKKKDSKLLREEIKLKIKNNEVLKSTDCESMSGMIVREIKRSKDIEVFEKNLCNVSNKKHYRKEILNLCSSYFGGKDKLSKANEN